MIILIFSILLFVLSIIIKNVILYYSKGGLLWTLQSWDNVLNYYVAV